MRKDAAEASSKRNSRDAVGTFYSLFRIKYELPSSSLNAFLLRERLVSSVHDSSQEMRVISPSPLPFMYRKYTHVYFCLLIDKYLKAYYVPRIVLGT